MIATVSASGPAMLPGLSSARGSCIDGGGGQGPKWASGLTVRRAISHAFAPDPRGGWIGPVRERDTSVVILGGGPGGYEAALVAAHLGASVTVVDRDGLGGAAVLTDGGPSRPLRPP